MKKAIYINQIIKKLIIIAFLFWAYKNNDDLIKFMIIPFIICVLISIMKNVFIIIGKDKYAKFCSKLYAAVFLLSATCFLIFWSYVVVKQKKYMMLLFTIVFWVMLIYFTYKYFLKKKETTLPRKSKFKFNAIIVVFSFLVFTVLGIGLYCLISGIKDTYNINQDTKGYLVTTAYFKDYEIFDTNKKWEHNRYKTDTTYTLIYTYKVKEKEYTIKTDYGSGYIPKLNSTRMVKYNPINPDKAVLVGMNRNNGLIYFGVFFFFGGMVFVLIFLQAKGIFDKVKIDVIGTYIGVVFTIIGIGIILIQNEMTLSFIETLKVMKFWILIPFMFIIIGLLLTIKSLFLLKVKK